MWSKKMVDTMLSRTPILSATRVNDRWSYDYGVVLKGVEKVWRQTGEQKYFDYIKANIDPFINEDGSITNYKAHGFNIDHINNGKVLLTLFNETGIEKYKLAADLLRKQLTNHPQTSEGVFWHKDVYPHQVWLDGLYMGAPFYAEYTKLFGDKADFDHIAKQFLLCAKNAKDSKTGLLYHGYDEKRVQPWCDPVTGLSKNFWGRSMGWFVMGLVDTLGFMDPGHETFNYLKKLLEDTLLALKNVQDETGVWYQVLDKGRDKGNYLEASGSCMNLYGMAKGLRLGLLGDEWLEVALKAYHGIIDEFIMVTEKDWVNLNKTCQVAGLGGADQRDGTYVYYISEPIICNDQKGIGAFILAMAEIEAVAEERGITL